MAKLSIDLYAQDGSPLQITPPLIYGRGVGGAELSMMTWAETMAARGHTVRVYNNPDTAGEYDGVEYLPQDAFQPGQYRDAFIVYRSPNPHIQQAKAGVKLHWSCDQYTIGDYAKDIVPYVDRVICISPYHVGDYQARLVHALAGRAWPRDNFVPDLEAVRQNIVNAPLHKITHIDLGVRLKDYPVNLEKIKNRFIFCSVPERGLRIVRQIWPEIKAALPDATLVITADHRLWGSHSPNNQAYRLDMIGVDGIVFLGAIERHKLTRYQCEAQIHLFPCVYEELFCISSAECQAAGAYSLTSNVGALATTNEFGLQLPGNPNDPAWQRRYTDLVLDVISNQATLTKRAAEGAKLARRRFDWERICDEWERVIEGKGVNETIL